MMILLFFLFLALIFCLLPKENNYNNLPKEEHYENCKGGDSDGE